jgi:hypothetical protein
MIAIGGLTLHCMKALIAGDFINHAQHNLIVSGKRYADGIHR